MYFSFGKQCALYIDASYADKWGNLSLEEVAENADKEIFDAALSKLSLFRVTQLTPRGCLKDGTAYCYSSTQFCDTKLGVMIQKNGDADFSLFATQECPEWFMLMTEVALLLSGQTFIHAAALEKDGRALLLPARGGVGKTATVIQLVRKFGWRLLGDDLVILDGEGSVRPFLKRFVIYGYHQKLFPELFEKHRGPVKNNTLNHMMSNAIPAVKRILRLCPPLLNFVRKHNPQQIRVSPHTIFEPEQISASAESILRTIWLERTECGEVSCGETMAEEVASCAAAVTLCELTYGAMNLNYCLMTMCSSGMLEYEVLYERPYRIILNSLMRSSNQFVKVPQRYPVDTVANYVYRQLHEME